MADIKKSVTKKSTTKRNATTARPATDSSGTKTRPATSSGSSKATPAASSSGIKTTPAASSSGIKTTPAASSGSTKTTPAASSSGTKTDIREKNTSSASVPTHYPLFYRNITPLQKEVHKDLYLEKKEDYSFTDKSNHIYLTAVEFTLAGLDYPIVFTQADETIIPVALLGFAQKKNLFLDTDGKWSGRYIPAYIRRYPFILASTEFNSDNFNVCIDETYSGFNTQKRGNPLFQEDGSESELLKNVVEFLREYQGHVNLTVRFCARLQQLELLEDVQANLRGPDGKEHSLSGFKIVNRDKLKNLNDTDTLDLVKTDMMQAIMAHVISMNNLHFIRDRFSAL